MLDRTSQVVVPGNTTVMEVAPVKVEETEAKVEAAAKKGEEAATTKKVTAKKVAKPKTIKKSAPTASPKDLKALKHRAEEVHKHDQAIAKADKSAMPYALAAGEHIAWGKAELKRLKIKRSFKKWMEEDCGVLYDRGYKYMRVYLAAKEDPTIKSLGFSEALIKLRCLTRGKNDQHHAGTRNTNNAGTNNTVQETGGDTGASSAAPRLKIGRLEVERQNGVYVLEIDMASSWRNAVIDAIVDESNFSAVLHNGGLLIRLKA